MIDNLVYMDKLLRAALEEDIGAGDITTDAIITPDARGKAVLLTRERIVLAGLTVFERVFKLLDPLIEIEDFYTDGQVAPPGVRICLLSGSLAVILKAERTALNFIQRMSGIATLTREYVEKAGSEKVKVLDTRKTAPGLRSFDKYAVRMGGGFNHRFGLYDAILIKDNHIAAVGSMTKAVHLAKKKASDNIKVEVEVEDPDCVEEAIMAGADSILLDNMSIDKIRQAVRIAAARIPLEVSGGVNLENINEIARTGIDFISVGALTHSVRAVDLSLELLPS
ncbi:MAG TPA: carboxylating nicotinate-nucleotide diphosphorylase [Desulfatiglandales bacterium]|nr:carboxylating nicotinate-nucleotide diphosphorylase [Desulfatiglandales bacterium]